MKTPILLAAALAFSGCAPAPADPGAAAAPPGSATLRLGGEARLGGIAVRALRLVEDSRCPASVQCVQAGTVRLAVRLRDGRTTREAVLRLGVAEPLGGGRALWLVAACPYPARPGAIRPADYRFRVAAAADLMGMPPGRECGPA
jgi:hypothetical protein